MSPWAFGEMLLHRLPQDMGLLAETIKRDRALLRGGPVPPKTIMVFGRQMTITQAAKAAGISRRELLRRLERGLSPNAAVCAYDRSGKFRHNMAALGLHKLDWQSAAFESRCEFEAAMAAKAA